MTDRLKAAFERQVKSWLASHPEVPHEWRCSRDLAGERIDLVCFPQSGKEVWATLRTDAVAIGAGSVHEDFETAIQGGSTTNVVADACRYFVGLIHERERDQAV